MSSSPSRAPSPPADPTPAKPEQAEALPFPYCEVTVSPSPALAGFQLPGGKSDSSPRSMAAEREGQARALGRQQGELECRAKFEEQLGRERSAVAAALADFARERGTYYQRLEQEAVQLALSIARKILHREAQVDPLLLMGVVRVALEKIEGASGVVLAVAPQQAPEWQRYLSTHLDPGTMPEIVEEAAMPPERCTLKTSMGTAELGLEVQLKEIEQGLMDLLAARPGEPQKEKP